MKAVLVVSASAVLFFAGCTPTYQAKKGADTSDVTFLAKAPGSEGSTVRYEPLVCANNKSYLLGFDIGTPSNVPAEMLSPVFLSKTVKLSAEEKVTLRTYSIVSRTYNVATTCDSYFTFTPKPDASYSVWVELAPAGCKTHVVEEKQGVTTPLVSEKVHDKACVM